MDKKVVYFAGSVRGDRCAVKTMKFLIESIQAEGIPVLSEHIIADNPAKALLKKAKEKKMTEAETIEHQDMAWLNQANHVIAEVSGASTGTGREIEYARLKEQIGEKPTKILAIYLKRRELLVSAMILGMKSDRYPNVAVRPYETEKEAWGIIKEFLGV